MKGIISTSQNPHFIATSSDREPTTWSVADMLWLLNSCSLWIPNCICSLKSPRSIFQQLVPIITCLRSKRPHTIRNLFSRQTLAQVLINWLNCLLPFFWTNQMHWHSLCHKPSLMFFSESLPILLYLFWSLNARISHNMQVILQLKVEVLPVNTSYKTIN